MIWRELYDALEAHLRHKNYTILTGARQVGKTSILKKLYGTLRSKGEHAVFINLENKEILRDLDKSPMSVFDFVSLKPTKIIDGKATNRIYIFIDEIQYLEDPSNFLKFLYDEYEYNVKIIATGSSAFYIDRKFKDSLAGSKRIFQLYPLSFREFLNFNQEEEIVSDIDYQVREPSYKSSYRRSIMSYLFEYLTYGGYPEVVLEDKVSEKKEILLDLKNSYLRKDILESGIEKESKFFILLRLLADQTGQLVNHNELGNTIGLDNKTVDRYVYILQKYFHIDLITPFYSNLRKELTKMSKLYFNDIGLRNVLLGNFDFVKERTDRGALLENFYYTQLRRRHDPTSIHYWRTADRNEVDFVIEEQHNKGYAIEVKWHCKQFHKSKYKKFIQSYSSFPLVCKDVYDKDILTT